MALAGYQLNSTNFYCRAALGHDALSPLGIHQPTPSPSSRPSQGGSVLTMGSSIISNTCGATVTPCNEWRLQLQNGLSPSSVDHFQYYCTIWAFQRRYLFVLSSWFSPQHIEFSQDWCKTQIVGWLISLLQSAFLLCPLRHPVHKLTRRTKSCTVDILITTEPKPLRSYLEGVLSWMCFHIYYGS